MKQLFWVLLGFSVTGLAFWMITMPGVRQSPPLMLLLIMVFVVPPFGSFWMMYMSIRLEAHPLKMILLAFVPYTFVWYYFERVRPRGKRLKERVGRSLPLA